MEMENSAKETVIDAQNDLEALISPVGEASAQISDAAVAEAEKSGVAEENDALNTNNEELVDALFYEQSEDVSAVTGPESNGIELDAEVKAETQVSSTINKEHTEELPQQKQAAVLETHEEIPAQENEQQPLLEQEVQDKAAVDQHVPGDVNESEEKVSKEEPEQKPEEKPAQKPEEKPEQEPEEKPEQEPEQVGENSVAKAEEHELQIGQAESGEGEKKADGNQPTESKKHEPTTGRIDGEEVENGAEGAGIDGEKAENDEPKLAGEAIGNEANGEKHAAPSASTKPAEPAVVPETPKQLPQLHSVLIPAYSHWFDLNKIHDREVKELPEFFAVENRDRSKTPVYYKTVRNFIVNTYRINPNEKLTFLSIRRNLTGDAGSLLRIFKFLEKWGIINYQVNFAQNDDVKNLVDLEENSQEVSETVRSILGKNLVPEDTSHFKVSSDAPKGLYPFKSYKPSINVQDLDYLKKIIKTKNGEPSFDISASVKKILKRKSPDENETTEDHPNKKSKLAEKWTKEEHSKLLELFYFFSKGGTSQIDQTQWLKIAQEINSLHANTVRKTPVDCILKFLQVPIEDDFLLENDKTGVLKYAPYLNGLGIEGAMGNTNNVANPILETLTTLVGYVDIKQLQQVLDFLKEKKKSENLEQEEDASVNSSGDSNFDQLVKLGFTSLAIRADKMALNEYAEFIIELFNLVENNIKKINLKMKKNDIIEALRLKEIEKLEKQRLELRLDKIRINKGLEILKNKYNIDNKNAELFSELSDLINRNCEFEEKHVTPGDKPAPSINNHAADDQKADEHDDLPLSIKSPSKYRYWSG